MMTHTVSRKLGDVKYKKFKVHRVLALLIIYLLNFDKNPQSITIRSSSMLILTTGSPFSVGKEELAAKAKMQLI